MENKQSCCASPVVAYDQGRIYCASCSAALPPVLAPNQVVQIQAGYTRTINWDRQIWSFPLTLQAHVRYDSWAQLRQAYLELFEEARKDVNNMVRAARQEFIDPHRRPEELV